MRTWAGHIVRVGNEIKKLDEEPSDPKDCRREIGPWLTSVIQSENLAVLVGSGLTIGACSAASVKAAQMAPVAFECEYEERVNESAAKSAKRMGREAPDVEDQIRSALQLIQGLRIVGSKLADSWEQAVDRVLLGLVQSVLASERASLTSVNLGIEGARRARMLLVSFPLSSAARPATRDRLRLFTTNYDRFIEYACDEAGLRIVDRFVGALSPVFQSSRLDVDMHYNPPGIRGEPRYLEGVVHLTKLHGSLDWIADGWRIRRVGLQCHRR